MLFDPARHEPLAVIPWDEARARVLIARIAAEAAAHSAEGLLRPVHPRDGGPARELHGELYHGACGVLWARNHLHALGAADAPIDLAMVHDAVRQHDAWQDSFGGTEFASFLMGDVALHLLEYDLSPTALLADRLEELVRGNMRHPARELMWGAPGTMLVALFLARHTQEKRWSALFREAAGILWSELVVSDEHHCSHWMHELHGQRSTFLGAVHGFVGTAAVILRGRGLLECREWTAWEQCIENTVARTVTLDADRANWQARLTPEAGAPPQMRMQFCHGAPGVMVACAELPGPALNQLLLAGGEAVWAAGPLVKGANLCHGTGGNGYAFLKLFRRTGDELWLERARAFAMHGMAQCERDAAHFGQMHFSLWTGDLGFAIYLWNCINGDDSFPCLDVFFAPRLTA